MTSLAGAIAAIDCGSNSTRLLVIGSDGGTLARLMRITRLGQGVDATGKLDGEAIDRTVGALMEFRRTMTAFSVARARAVATSAVRDAVNGQEFLNAASRALAVGVELLSGDEEGQLAYTGATANLPPIDGEDVVIDIGGGSTEIVVGRRGSVRVVSLDLGCVRLTERHLRHDPPTPAELAEANATIELELDRADRSIPALAGRPPGSRLTGLAGTVSTLSMLDQRAAEYERDRIHHAVLLRSSVERWCGTLAAEPARERARRPGMVAGREDVIVGGALVLRDAMRRYGFVECIVSESDILDGLAASVRA